jgi:hypothetical protein
MNPRTILRLEGVAVFAAATGAYFGLGAPVWLFLVLALAPDVAMVGYLAGTRVGRYAYNAFHTYVGPVALVWTAHIGVDRAVGYGLKYSTAFKHTHLSGTQTVPAVMPVPEDVADEDVPSLSVEH